MFNTLNFNSTSNNLFSSEIIFCIFMLFVFVTVISVEFGKLMKK